MPTSFNPAGWLELVDHQPRPVALVVFVVALSMLGLGLRGFRYYVCVGAAVLAYIGGLQLAKLMHVTGSYVGGPAALLAIVLAWPLAARAIFLGLAFGLGACTAAFFTYALDIRGYYWGGFVGGAAFGLALALLSPRFATAFFCAGFGTAGVIASVGALVRAEGGPFAIAGYTGYPNAFLIGSTVLFIASFVMQVVLDPDESSYVGEEAHL